MAFNKTNLPKALVFGTASAVLYTLLFVYSDHLVEYAHRTRQGEHIWFVVPIIIAFIFSYFHGAFTGYFWDVLGLTAAQKTKSKSRN